MNITMGATGAGTLRFGGVTSLQAPFDLAAEDETIFTTFFADVVIGSFDFSECTASGTFVDFENEVDGPLRAMGSWIAFSEQTDPVDVVPEACDPLPEPIVWANAAGGAFNDADNWVGSAVPGTDDTAKIAATTDPITVQILEPLTNDSLIVEDAQVTLTGTNAYGLSGNCRDSISVNSKDSSGTVPTELTITGVTFTVTAQDVSVEGQAGTTQFATLTVSNSGALTANATCVLGEEPGNSHIEVNSGAEFRGFDVTLGFASGSFSTTAVSNLLSKWTVLQNGLFTIGFLGTGQFAVGDGATVNLQAGAATVVGSQSGSSQSAVLVEGSGTSWTSQGPTTVGDAGQGEFQIKGGAGVEVQQLTVGKQTSGDGSIELSETFSSLTVNDFTVVAELGKGQITITNRASVESKGVSSIGASGGSEGAVTVEGSDATSRSEWLTQDTLNVGFGGKGDLIIRNFGSVSSTAAILGVTATGSGLVEITTGARWIVSGEVQVGRDGVGVLTVDDESTLQAQLVGVSSLSQIGSTLIHIGGAAAPGGIDLGGSPKRFVNAQTNEVPTTGIVTEALNGQQGAQINAETVTLADGGTLSGSAAISGDLVMTGGLLEVEIAGSEPGQHDTLNIAGTADLSGGTIVFKFIDDYTPRAGAQLDFLDSAGGTTMGNVNLEFEGVAEGFEFQVNNQDGNLTFQANTNARSLQPVGVCGQGVFGGLPLVFVAFCCVKLRLWSRRGVNDRHVHDQR